MGVVGSLIIIGALVGLPILEGGAMRTSRIVEDGPACYHILSRVVDRRMIFDSEEKERFRTLLRAVAGFCGVEVLTYALLDNHWHILVHIPQREEVSDSALGVRLALLYRPAVADGVMQRLADLRSAGRVEAAEALKAGYTYRMHDLSEFVKTLKQRVSQSYNRRHGRKGTLWEERFKSVLVGEHAVRVVAAYIDLNAVRAGMVGEAGAYRYCGYGEAMAGVREARQGICRVMGMGRWGDAAAGYRRVLEGRGGCGEGGSTAERGLPLEALLRHRVRYFSDGAILGSRLFVEAAFVRHRTHFGVRRQTGARRMRGGAWGELYAARALRLDVISPPSTG